MWHGSWVKIIRNLRQKSKLSSFFNWKFSFAWFGRGSDDKEKAALSIFAEKIGAAGSIEEADEGSESDDFWEILGGKDEYFTLPRKSVGF